MDDPARPGLGRRLYLNLFKIFGPADHAPVGEPPPHNPNDPTVPSGFHLETVTHEGVRKRIMVPDQTD